MVLEDLIKDHIEALKANTEAHIDHTDLLKKMLDSKGGSASTGDDDNKPRRTRRTNAQIEADKAAEAEKAGKDKPKDEDRRDDRRDDRRSETPKDDDELAAFRREVKKFIDHDDEKEAELRTDFVDKINKYFDVDSARDIPAKNFKKVLRWIKIFAGGDKVDFEND